MVTYVNSVVYVTVIRELLFVLYYCIACMLGECDSVRVTEILVWGIEEVWLW